tara:strand:- start:108 stop:626 length:519 start_codon:yes stop_codon:yes gene_type:complete
MKIRIFHIITTIFFLILFFIFYKGLKNSNIYTPDLSIKKDTPIFEAKLFDSNDFISSKKIFKKNKFYIMNIWASWCVPCRAEHSFLLELNNQKNIKIIGINYKDKIENAKKFLKEFKSPYEIIVSDKDGLISIEWGAYGVPETFLIHNGKILRKYVGPLNKNSVSEIKRLIK